MNQTDIITIITIGVTWVLGYFSKKSKFIENNLIPFQNIAIGLIIAIVEFIITKDFSVAIASSGLFAGGSYDVVHNLSKLKNYKKVEEK